jgi:NTE family protein
MARVAKTAVPAPLIGTEKEVYSSPTTEETKIMQALVLSGGGASGAYEVGAIKYLSTALGIHPDIICGTSVGAINGAFLTQFEKGNEIRASIELEHLWRGINTNCIYQKWYYGLLWYVPILWKKSVYNTEPIQRLLRNNLDVKRIAASKRQLRVIATSLSTGECRSWSEKDEDIIEGVLTSSSYPIFFEPIIIDQVPWSDGGLRNITPLRTAIGLGATEIFVITCQPSKVTFKPKPSLKVLDQIPRVLDIMTNEINRDDIRKTELVNELVKKGCAPEKRDIKIRMVQAQNSLGDSLDFSPAKNEALIALGFLDASKQLKYLL